MVSIKELLCLLFLLTVMSVSSASRSASWWQNDLTKKHSEEPKIHSRKWIRRQQRLLHNNRHTMHLRDPSNRGHLAAIRSFLDEEDDFDHSRSLRSAQMGYVKPDECPPRQEGAIEDADSEGSSSTPKNGKKRTCPRKCSKDGDCMNDRKLCLCDGPCGMSCIRPEKECPELPDPPHGQVHLTGRHYNDRAVYTCDDGYQIVGLEQVICNSNGHWSGAQPSCKQAATNAQSRYYCGEPTVIPHAKHNGSSEQMFYNLDTELSYQCDPGYKRKGFQEAQCFFYNGTARWFGPDLTCHPIDCGAPEEILNGERAGDCTTYRCQIKYRCVAGFELVGKDTRYCQSDGTWTPSELPTCVPVQCPIPDSPSNGKAMFTAVAYKSVVSYECKYGYMVVGDATRTCGEDKKWTGEEPKCKEINCGSPGFLPNGWLEGSRTTLHSVVMFRCIEGMTFDGKSFRTTCQADGTWSHPLPKCLAPCIVPEVVMGRAVNLTTGSPVRHGQNISVECDGNYEMAANSTIQCNNGTWTQIPRCEPARCKSLPSPPLNGMIVVPRTKHGGVGLYQCKDGYILKGPNITRCNYGNWSEETPSCELVYCPFPGYIKGGKVLLVGNMGLYDYRPYVKKVKNNRQIMFECGRGSKLVDGPPGATCIDGRWSPSTLPRCVEEFHPKMEWLSKRSADNYYSDAKAGPLIPKRVKRALRKRELGGRHRRSKDASHHRDCDPLTDANLQVEIVRPGRDPSGENALFNNARGSILRINCNEGYTLNLPKKKVRCKRAEWKPEVPICTPIACKLPRLPNNGQGGHFVKDGQTLAKQESVDHGEEIDLQCNEGHYLNGPERLRCWAGEWTGGKTTGMPKCVGNPCTLPDITGLPGGRYIGSGGNYRAGQVMPHDALIKYVCPDQAVDRQPLQCKLGRLVPTDPHCGSFSTATSSWMNRGSKLEYSASSHILKNGDFALKDLPPNAARLTNVHQLASSGFQKMKASCQRPNRVDGTLTYRGDSHEPIVGDETQNLAASLGDIRFPHGTEVRFDCLKRYGASHLNVSLNMMKLRSWKIVCQDGRWTGLSLGCDEQGNPLLSEEAGEAGSTGFNASCRFDSEPMIAENVAAFYEDQELTDSEARNNQQFEPGAEVVFRCVDIGKYVLEGSSQRRCVGGMWDGVAPVCVGLNQHFNYSIEKPPTILFRHRDGHIAQTNDGQLVITPGTIVHMECLYRRHLGSPEWHIENYSGRTYPQGWTTDPGRDARLEYRLSIYHARVNDTGTYTCSTPSDKRHTVKVIVEEVKCPDIVATEGLSISNREDVDLNARITFSCTNGNSLIGSDYVTCLPSGHWSAPIPACQDVVCTENITHVALSRRPNLRVHVHSYAAGGHAYFSCQRGHTLVGVDTAKCLDNGEWSVSLVDGQQMGLPDCEPIVCSKPDAPVNGDVSADGMLSVGRMVKFHCNQGYMMEGQPIMTCIEVAQTDGKRAGKWNDKVPACVRACTYPGSVIGGMMVSDVRFYYHVGATVSYACAPGLALSGAKMLECLGTGVWSSAVPTCGKPKPKDS